MTTSWTPDNHIMDAVKKARERGLDEFDSDRASNVTFEDLVFFERQAYLNMADRGTTTRSVGQTQRFERLSDCEETPHPDTHLRTMKQTATPAAQTTLDEYENGRRPTDWQRIRDEVRENGGPRDCTLTELTAALDVSKGGASRILHRAEDRSIKNFLRTSRVNRAVVTENIAMEAKETESLELGLSDTLCSRHPIQAIISDLVAYC